MIFNVPLVIVLAGFVVGGFIFRVRSQHWPHDSSARHRQFIYAFIAVALPPAMMLLFAASNAQGVLIGTKNPKS